MLESYNPPTDPFLTIIYQDNDLVVCDKPSGLLSVRGKHQQHQDSLQARLEKVWPQLGIVHRLDMSTSGLMISALNRSALSHLNRQFQQRQTQKTYIAKVWGQLASDTGEVDLPLIVDWPNRPKQKVCYKTGKFSQTLWQTIDYDGQISRVKLTPVTGRSHQLRVHMAEIGHPIIGDKFYAHKQAYLAASRLNLHAQSLTIRHPTDNRLMKFESGCPF